MSNKPPDADGKWGDAIASLLGGSCLREVNALLSVGLELPSRT